MPRIGTRGARLDAGEGPASGSSVVRVQCAYFDAGVCRSCTWLERPYAEQLAGKHAHAVAALGERVGQWLPPVASPEAGYRNKAKMVVGGSVDAPVVGILDERGRAVDLQRCGLHTPGIRAALPVLAEFVTRASLEPYDVAARRGELKYLLVTEAPGGALMVRFVCRSTEPLARLRKHLPWLRSAVPGLRVASLNVQPRPAAVLEGEREELLTEDAALPMGVNGIELLLRPQSFFQTNTDVAAELYRQARAWVAEVDPSTVWDLYCGVGGFALHVADGARDVVGIEWSAEAVASAADAARRAGIAARFAVGDAPAFAREAGAAPDLVVVNPPRRGIGDLAAFLEGSRVRHVVYSSCNVASLARDLAAMPSLVPVRARVLDMFPQTAHYEVIALLERGAASPEARPATPAPGPGSA